MGIARFIDPAGSIRTGEWRGKTVRFADREHNIEEVEILPPVSPNKVIGVGPNFRAMAEMDNQPIPERPPLFMKPPNSLSGHGDTVTLPDVPDPVVFEAEIGVVIGEQCKNVGAGTVEEVIEGFTCVNDISIRDPDQLDENWDTFRTKVFDNSLPIGPQIVPIEEVPEDARISLRVNGQTKQNSSRDKFIFSVPQLVEEITRYITLEPDDVIITGSPPPLERLEDGDFVEVDIEGIGTLEHYVSVE